MFLHEIIFMQDMWGSLEITTAPSCPLSKIRVKWIEGPDCRSSSNECWLHNCRRCMMFVLGSCGSSIFSSCVNPRWIQSVRPVFVVVVNFFLNSS